MLDHMLTTDAMLLDANMGVLDKRSRLGPITDFRRTRKPK
jgi:hypothetical protein